MGISHYIKEIGRGKEGARSLTREQSRDLMSQVLDRSVTDLEIGAFALAMRIKGESLDELRGFLDAVHERCVPIESSTPAVVIASYNGARRLPNLTALLALLLAQEGVPVLVHGPASDRNRVTTAQVHADLGLPIARAGVPLADEAGAAWSRREPLFVPIDVLCPPLARLLDVRWTVGLRNSGHTVAKLLDPLPGAVRLISYTHPEYGALLREFAGATAANAMLLRGTEGEPVADPRRMPRMDVFLHGLVRVDLSVPAHEGVLADLPLLPRENDSASTALYIQAVVSGEKPAPRPIVKQLETLMAALRALASDRVAEEAVGA